MASFQGKVFAITGAASGIGLATAHLLASRGASLVLADIQQERLETAVDEISKTNSDAEIFSRAIDVVKAEEVTSWLDDAIKLFGKLNGAANLAGILRPTGPVQETTDEDWNAIIDVNVKGVFHCLRAQLSRIEENGSIVNAASVAGLAASPATPVYAASKHAVIGLSRSAAKEAGARNVRVNCIAPGAIETPMIAIMGPGLKEDIVQGVSLGRLGKPEEVAKLIAFLLSDESSYTTGSVYVIDGGFLT